MKYKRDSSSATLEYYVVCIKSSISNADRCAELNIFKSCRASSTKRWTEKEARQYKALDAVESGCDAALLESGVSTEQWL